ncbi:MAG TPA: SUMF1/EgtB/PvdO family nonheme iron enzyme, partial [Planctomycetota bacterium]|nr:SUMF1/EgtB/PvdO family nonheme iron enzyme [Planctomycetota bacterium]
EAKQEQVTPSRADEQGVKRSEEEPAPSPLVKPDDKSESAPPPPFLLEQLEPAESPMPAVGPEKKTLHVAGRASRPLVSVRVEGKPATLDPDDPMRFETEVELEPAPMNGKDEDRALKIELVDQAERKSVTRMLNYRRVAARMPKNCSPAPGATVDERGRVTAIEHGNAKTLLALVDEGPSQPGFYLGVHELTYDEWQASPTLIGWESPKPPEGADGGKHPIVSVPVEKAKQFCSLRGLRLPTSAEWLTAAKLAMHAYPWGEEFVVGNCNSAGKGPGGGTKPVASFEHDRCGPFFDMAGNVQELCLDAKGDPVVHGGGWRSTANACKLANAAGVAGSAGSASIGIRVAMSFDP